MGFRFSERIFNVIEEDYMRVVFMGSAEIACPSLEALLAEPCVDVVGVVTQPDRPKGRRLKLAECAVKASVADLDIPILTPENINTAEALDVLRSWTPDLVVVIAYGQILRPNVLAIPPLGCINIHTSLLPRYRGAAPIQWAVTNGDAETGATIMFMDEGMDTGDIIAQRSIPIGRDETAGMVHDHLAKVGASLLCEVVKDLLADKVDSRSQCEAEATYAPKLKKRDGEIDWTLPAEAIYNRVRGFNPWPCCYCFMPHGINGTLRVKMARLESGNGAPGEVLSIKGDGPVIACGVGALRLLEVQPEGKRSMAGSAFVCGRSLAVGDSVLGADS
jgi:methionyl-tRNA formyltransferase